MGGPLATSILFLSFPVFLVLGAHFFCLSRLCFWLSTQFLNWPPIAGDGWPCCPHLGLTPFGIQTQDRSQKCKDIEDFFCRGLTFFLCFSICNQHAVSERQHLLRIFFLLRIPTNRVSAWFSNFKFAAKKIDVFSRVLFPGVFAVFNFLYWTYFLTRWILISCCVSFLAVQDSSIGDILSPKVTHKQTFDFSVFRALQSYRRHM